jgi:hypothetical protein
MTLAEREKAFHLAYASICGYYGLQYSYLDGGVEEIPIDPSMENKCGNCRECAPCGASHPITDI